MMDICIYNYIYIYLVIYLNWMIVSYGSCPIDIAVWLFNIANWTITIVNRLIIIHDL